MVNLNKDYRLAKTEVEIRVLKEKSRLLEYYLLQTLNDEDYKELYNKLEDLLIEREDHLQLLQEHFANGG